MGGWFVVNVADATAVAHSRAGASVRFEDGEDPFPELGVNIRVLQPGQPNGLYHSENSQEDFLVLGGECLAILDGEERTLRAWDFVHCPAGTPHVFVGAGTGPCWILMVGARRADRSFVYLADEAAARHGAAADRTTSDPREAYSKWTAGFVPTQIPWPPA
jgi:uncharacterized cupin superfamily protein